MCKGPCDNIAAGSVVVVVGRCSWVDVVDVGMEVWADVVSQLAVVVAVAVAVSKGTKAFETAGKRLVGMMVAAEDTPSKAE